MNVLHLGRKLQNANIKHDKRTMILMIVLVKTKCFDESYQFFSITLVCRITCSLESISPCFVILAVQIDKVSVSCTCQQLGVFSETLPRRIKYPEHVVNIVIRIIPAGARPAFASTFYTEMVV